MKKRNMCRGLAVLGVLAASLGTFCMTASAAVRTVSSGVTIDGMDVGGMTREEVKTLITDKITSLRGETLSIRVGDNDLTCTFGDLGLQWSNSGIVTEAMNLGASGNIVQRYKDQADLTHESKAFSLEYVLSDTAVTSYVSGLSAYNTEPVNATIYTTDELKPGVEGGTDGITLNQEQAVSLLKSTIEDWDGHSEISLELPVDRVSPDVTYEQLAVISDVLGQATTDYSSSSYARATNVENGCRKISGTLLYPGESFSVTDAVVPFTAENGYEPAPSYEENRVVDSYGGGICQVSTTLYNAVLKSELEVIARSNHTMVVSYVDLSKDAAIAEGVMDFAFYNNLEDPVYIVGYAYAGQLSFIIYGHETRPSNRSIDFESRTIQTVEPSAAKIIANSSQPVGYINQTQSPHTGYTAELWKNIYYDGVWSDCVQINTSYYNAVGTIYDVGIATEYPALSQAINTAIASGDISQVQTVIAQAATYQNQPQTDAPAQTPEAGQVWTDPGSGDYDEPVMVY
ncbi:MAG: VanW family protein [Lachnospiraceae bacterium]|nr:VanW family protein [Lachnospiraceae bacterium]